MPAGFPLQLEMMLTPTPMGTPTETLTAGATATATATAKALAKPRQSACLLREKRYEARCVVAGLRSVAQLGPPLCSWPKERCKSSVSKDGYNSTSRRSRASRRWHNGIRMFGRCALHRRRLQPPRSLDASNQGLYPPALRVSFWHRLGRVCRAQARRT